MIQRFFNKTLDIYVFIIMIITIFITGYPFLYILFFSISDPLQVTGKLIILPLGINLYAYIAAIRFGGILHAFLVSVERSVIGSLGTCLISMMTAFVLTKTNLLGRKFILPFFIITMYFSVGLIPTYLWYKSIFLIKTFWVYIIPALTSVFSMVVLKTYIESLPCSMEESACIDGASEPRIFFSIIIPVCMPVIAAILLFQGVNQWNSYTDTMIYNAENQNLYPLQYVLMNFVYSQASRSVQKMAQSYTTGGLKLTPLSVRMAVTIITILPISLLYPILQKYFIKGMLIGAVKG
jgi:putative aldouronate transport system permease protein